MGERMSVGNLSVLLLAACSGPPADSGAVDAHADGAHQGSETNELDDDADLVTDEAMLRAAIAGELDAAQALAAVARSGGLPVETSSGAYIFACLCGSESWSLTGAHSDWTRQEMSRTGALSWIEVEIPDPDGSMYKFTDGSRWVEDPYGRRYGHDGHGAYSLVRSSAAHLQRWYSLTDGALPERDLHVWVPDDGTFTHALYIHDGQNLFDPQASWGGWRLQESVPEGMLLIGIENTQDRIDEYTHTTDVLHGQTHGGQGAQYAALVEETVRPLMEAAYGTPEVVGVMGSSLGGLISLYIAHRYPGRYDLAASLSGTVGWGSLGASQPTIIELMEAAGHQTAAIYIDSGGSGSCIDSDEDGIVDDGDDFDNYCVNLQLRDVLAATGYFFDVDLWHWHEKDAPHNEYAWSERVYIPLNVFASL